MPSGKTKAFSVFSVLRYSKKIKKKKEVVGEKLKGECLRLQQCERKKFTVLVRM